MSDHRNLKHTRQMEILARIGGRLHTAADTPSLCRLLIESAVELVDAHCGMAGLLIDEQMLFREYYKNNLWSPIHRSFEPGQGVPGWVIEHRKPYFTNDAEHDAMVDHEAWLSLRFYNLITVPIIDRQGLLLGCFNIHNSVEKRPFDEQDVIALEMLAGNAALALDNLKGLEQQRRSFQSELVMNTLLELSMLDMPLSEILTQSLDTILDTPWLPLKRMGAIFLAEHEPDVLVMSVQRNCPPALQSQCARVDFGCCLCGVAAEARMSLFAAHGDKRYNHCRNVLGEHAHYAIPLLHDDTVLGLFVLYLDRNHRRKDRELKFLNSIARILSGIIIRKRDSEQFQAKAANYSKLIESTRAVAWRVDMASNQFIYIAPQIESLLGYPTDSWKDINTWISRIHSDDRERVTSFCFIESEQGRDHDFSYRAIAADGRTVWIRDVVSVVKEDGKPVELVGFMFDITAKKQAAELLNSANAQFSSILEIAPDAIISIDEQQHIIVFNKGAEHIFGYNKQEVMGCSLEMLIPERFAATHTQYITHFGEKKELSKTTDLREHIFVLRKGGEEFPAEASISKLCVDGKCIHTIVLRDITARKRAEAEMLKLSQVVAQGDEAVLVTDTNAVIEYVNPAFTKITGYSPKEAIGKTPSLLKSTAQDPDFYKEMWQTISSGRIWHGMLIDRRKDGSYYPAQTTVAPIRSENGEITHYVGMHRDMTEHRKLEEQFQQAQKMDAIGTLVGGIAHDFNNMLSGMLGNIYLAKRKIGHLPDAISKLDNVEQLGYSAAEMITQLLTFARKGRVQMTAFSFTPFVKESVKLARVSIPESIKVSEHITAHDMFITGDTTQLQQVLLNLLNNARDAVLDSPQPHITICLDRCDADEQFKSMHPELKSDHFAHFSVSDNGYGIKKKHLDKIFEPFFTTKAEGKGTGLGLAMSYGAIQTHQGMLEVESEKHIGTTFHVYLPLQETNQSPIIACKERVFEGHGETILLVDDEPHVRETVAEVLESIAYTVLKASNGVEALQMFAAHRNEIALVLTDVVMPEMGGIAVSKEIRKLSDVPIILMTGYDKEHVLDGEIAIEHCEVVNKPIKLTHLSRVIRSFLDT